VKLRDVRGFYVTNLLAITTLLLDGRFASLGGTRKGVKISVNRGHLGCDAIKCCGRNTTRRRNPESHDIPI